MWRSSHPSPPHPSPLPRIRLGAHAQGVDADGARPLSRVSAMVALLRVRQWSKNGLVVLALIYSGDLAHRAVLTRVGLAFAAFCLLSSAIYCLNDLVDRQADARHPRKRFRPLAAGVLSPRDATALAAGCLAGVTILTLALTNGLSVRGDPYGRWGGSGLLIVAAFIAYLVIHIAYAFRLKRLALFDALAIATGFTLRAFVGALAIPAPISPWFYICAMFLALFLAFGKCRAELVALGDHAHEHRQALGAYPLALLDQLLTVTATCAVVTYSLYTVQGNHVTQWLMLTIPLALFGVMRYLYLIHTHAAGEQPEETLIRDPQMRGVVALYLSSVAVILYALPHALPR